MKLLPSILKKSYFSSMNRGLAHIQRLDTKKGIRTQVKVKLGRQNFYLYSALEMERVLAQTSILIVFLEQMSQYLGTRETFLIMDCASWKKFKGT